MLDRGYHSAVERGAKSLADDLGMDRGVVPSRAAASLRSAETNPFDPRDLSALMDGRILRHSSRGPASAGPCGGTLSILVFAAASLGCRDVAQTTLLKNLQKFMCILLGS